MYIGRSKVYSLAFAHLLHWFTFHADLSRNLSFSIAPPPPSFLSFWPAILLPDLDIQCIIVSYVKLLQVDPEIITFLVQMGVIGMFVKSTSQQHFNTLFWLQLLYIQYIKLNHRNGANIIIHIFLTLFTEHLEEIRALHIRDNFIKTIIPDLIKSTLGKLFLFYRSLIQLVLLLLDNLFSSIYPRFFSL